MCAARLFLLQKIVPAKAGTEHVWMGYDLQSSLHFAPEQSSPKTVPKPQQERGLATGENKSKGKRISSKPLQGSLFAAFAEQRSGTHLPRE